MAEEQPRGVWRVWALVRPWWAIFAFLAGFLWDSLTLRRIDRLSDNLLLLGYLLVLGAFLVAEIRVAAKRAPRLERWKAWITWGAQFLFGGLFSAYLVFYFKSASPGRAMLFLAFLAAVMVANEFVSERLQAERLRVGLYWLCAFSFLLFFVPVWTGFPGPGLFLIAAIGAFGMAGAVTALGWAGHPSLKRSLVLNSGIAAGLCVVLGAMSWLNIIPPVPFAMMEIGVFHDVTRTDEGYVLTYESPPWWLPRRNDDREFHFRPGDQVSCFTAVFAPNGMKLDVRHVWERYDAVNGWVTVDDLRTEVKGGRGGGFRTWTTKRNLVLGDWRVRVVTGSGSELAIYPFTLDDGSHTAPAATRARVYQ